MRKLRYSLPLILVVGLLAYLFLTPDKAFHLLGQAIDAHGGERNFERTRTGRVKGGGTELVAYNWPFTWEETFVWPNRLRRVTTKMNMGQKFTLTQLYRDSKCWTYDNGKELEVQAASSTDTMVRLGDILGQLVQIRRANAPLTYLAPEEGSDQPGVEVQSDEWGTIRLYFDPQRKLLARMNKEGQGPDGRPAEVQLLCSNYRDFDGIAQPGTVRLSVAGQLVREWTIMSVQFLDRIDPAEFEKP